MILQHWFLISDRVIILQKVYVKICPICLVDTCVINELEQITDDTNAGRPGYLVCVRVFSRKNISFLYFIQHIIFYFIFDLIRKLIGKVCWFFHLGSIKSLFSVVLLSSWPFAIRGVSIGRNKDNSFCFDGTSVHDLVIIKNFQNVVLFCRTKLFCTFVFSKKLLREEKEQTP